MAFLARKSPGRLVRRMAYTTRAEALDAAGFSD